MCKTGICATCCWFQLKLIMFPSVFVLISTLAQICWGQLSSSYIPAAMQIITHDTELMKYVIKPPQSTTTTTTTLRPTPTHKPGVLAPVKPLGANEYFSKDNTEAQYLAIQQEPSGFNYFDKYNTFIPGEHHQSRTLEGGQAMYKQVDQYLGKRFGNLLRLANKFDPDVGATGIHHQVLDFSKNFEDPDSEYRYEILAQKKVPPTKAYVTLLSIYDQLNKESKRLMLNKFVGYTDEVLNNLVKFSSSTSAHQLRSVLNKIVENGDTRKADVLTKLKTLISDLDDPKSYISEALQVIPPLVFAH